MTHTRSLIYRSLLTLAFTATLAATAQATNYSPLVGPNLTYSNISENDTQLIGPPAVNSSPTGLFGQPILTPAGSNILSFNDSTFSVAVAGGTFETQDGKLTMDITPTIPGSGIHKLSLDEGGAWQVIGADGTGISAPAYVTATLLFNDLRITAVNGVALGSAITVHPTFSLSATTQIGAAHTSTSTGADTGNVQITSAGGSGQGLWDIVAAFDIDAALAGAGKSGKVTSLSLALDDKLLGNTISANGLTLAEIDKKHIILTPTTDPVPEPSTIVLGLVGGMGLLVGGRKWRKASQA
jgi:hypothetical protein